MVTTHDLESGDKSRIVFASLTISDSRGAAADASAPLIERLVVAAGYRFARASYAHDQVKEIRRALEDLLASSDIHVIVVTGGTGFAPRDVTVDALDDCFERRIPGFGEIFRRLSFDAIGAAAMLTRASAGVMRGRPVFLLPGSPKAVSLALDRLILPAAAHLIDLLDLAQQP